MSLDLHADPVDLTAALVDVLSVSGDEAELATASQDALREQAPHLEVIRNGDTVLARTDLGRASRVVLAGHLDTVPENGNLPSRREGTGDDEILHGLGTVDMKGGDAVFLHLAATLREPQARPDVRVLRQRRDRSGQATASAGSSASCRSGCTATSRSSVSRPTG